MGLFSSIKDVINLIKEVKSSIKAYERYISMSDEEVLALDDNEFYDAVYDRIGEKVDKADSFDVLNKSQLAFFILHELVMDMNNGGLCQYLCNSAKERIENVPYCLKTMGFEQTAALFNQFVFDNDIDFSMLDDEELDYEEFYESYDFDSFDEKFYEIYENEPIYDTLVKFARENYDTISE